MTAPIFRRAVIKNKAERLESIRRFMPSNYTADTVGEDVVITGADYAGWTLDGYVLPRLASGMFYAREVVIDVIDRYHVNDVLTALATEHGVTLDDGTLDELTHAVADAIDAAGAAQAHN